MRSRTILAAAVVLAALTGCTAEDPGRSPSATTSGGRDEARNVWRAVRDAPALARTVPPPAPGDPASRPS